MDNHFTRDVVSKSPIWYKLKYIKYSAGPGIILAAIKAVSQSTDQVVMSEF